MEDGNVICKRCNGRGEYRLRFYYKENAYYYFEKCAHCYARGYNDWIEVARGRRPGFEGLFCDNHPAGSMVLAPEKLGGCSVYDGHNYIDSKTERGEALWHELVSNE